MKNSSKPPIYSQVAYDIAKKIATGELREGDTFSGRSLLSTEYGVSPETIRRALKQLADMGIVEVRKNVGAVVLSKESAAEFIQKFQAGRSVRELRRELESLVAQRNRLNEEIAAMLDRILDLNSRFRKSDYLSNYEFEIQPNSHLLGRTIGELGFRQNTGGTIVAVRSSARVQLSPGPEYLFQPGDTLIVAASPDAVERVMAFITNNEEEK